MKIKPLITTLVLAGMLTACSSTKNDSASSSRVNIPDWVLNPVVENGIAAADCIKYSGNISVDQKMAVANARLALAQQIEVRIEGLDKTFANRTDANDAMTVGSTFSSVSKQLTKQTLNGSRVVKADVVDISGKDYFCALTTLSPELTKTLFKDLIQSAKPSIDPRDEQFLYQEFKAFKAEQDLEKEIERLTN
ncbi:LPP20 family lipoprotein [Pseudoalteromonas sp. MMG022]|uniref:LPP20 family lipoprotein n=1 Tax=Pseudoalteromonas sp. MMG022 TaxID=2909978 RepID=UPI001F2DE558|nr:LPP20 family lipoprotein [Pseudoalteromonas sp. MMG022]MCF6434239.1 LPP20 family lipoprotein [Pseudoalteromonas sp. MMG022]